MHTEYSFDDLLAEHPYERPLVVDGVPCHGGFVGGRYVSPRTLRRAGAIDVARRDACPQAACAKDNAWPHRRP